MRFVESHLFTAKIQAIRGEEALRELQLFLIEQPEAGKVVAGTGGFRKVRMAIGGSGKRGGGRAIYLLLSELPCIVFVLLYTKGEADNISATGKEFLRKASAEIKANQHLIP